MMSKKSPQLRFEGFTDDWEVRKLTDVTYSYSGLTYSPTDVQDKGTFVLRSSKRDGGGSKPLHYSNEY